MNFWTVLNWGMAIAGTVGVVGLIALVIFAPAVAQVLLNGAVGILRWLLSTRVGVAILVGGICLIGGELAGDYHGRSVADAACKAAQERADAEAAARDKQQGVIADKDAQKRIAVLEKSAKRDREKIDALRKATAGKACRPVSALDLR